MACRPADRMGLLRTVLNLSTAEFAAALDLPERRVRRILKSHNKPSVTLLARVRRSFPYINPDWLLLGEGPLFFPHHPSHPTGNTIGTNHGTCHQNYTVLTCRYDLAHCRGRLELLQQQLRDKERIINLLERISASPV